MRQVQTAAVIGIFTLLSVNIVYGLLKDIFTPLPDGKRDDADKE